MADVREEVPISDALPISRERRRPGRIPSVNPALIPLLRGEDRPPCDYEVIQEHDLAPATGVAVSVVLSGLIWFAIGCIVYFG